MYIRWSVLNVQRHAPAGGLPRLARLENSHTEMPSAIFCDEKSHEFYFGRTAVAKYLGGEEGRLMRSLKRALGTNLMATGTLIGARTERFQDAVGAFLGNIKNKLDAAARAEIKSAVMGRPVHFQNDPSLDAAAESELRGIAHAAGFREVLFQYEPIAAAFAHERRLDEEVLAAVIDIGGGTSDFSIIRIGGAHAKKADRREDILANTGVRVGGNDFDKQFSLSCFMPEFGMGTEYEAPPKILPMPNSFYFDLSEWSRINFLYNYKNLNAVRTHLLYAREPEKVGRLVEVIERRQGHKILAYVEDLKIRLSACDAAAARLDFLTRPVEIPATRDVFQQAIAQEVEKASAALRKCIRQSGVRADSIGLVVLTGGSAEIPFVREALCGMFSNARISGEDKLNSVGLGLGFDAVRRLA